MHSGSVMASKNVALRMDVVRKLDRIRRPGESYSDVIDRHVGPKQSWNEVIQYLRKHPMKGPDTLGPILRQVRRELNESFEARRKRHEKMP